MTDEISVEEVSADGRRISLRVMNMRFVFVRKSGGGIKLISKSKLEAQIHDPNACWVPKSVFIAAFRKAGAILKNR